MQPQSFLYTSFLKALEEPQFETDQVVFAGDIFDLLVGDSDHFREKNAGFLQALQTLDQKGVKLFYIEGNHDFHLKSFLKGIKVHFENEAVIFSVDSSNGKKMFYIGHGDLVNEEDVGYLRLRGLFRSKPVQMLADFLPGVWIEKMGDIWSRPLAQKADEIPENWDPAQLQKLREIYRRFAEGKRSQGFDYVILGHCHDRDQLAPFYWNMGYPPVHRQFLYYDATEDLVKRREFPGINI